MGGILDKILFPKPKVHGFDWESIANLNIAGVPVGGLVSTVSKLFGPNYKPEGGGEIKRQNDAMNWDPNKTNSYIKWAQSYDKPVYDGTESQWDGDHYIKFQKWSSAYDKFSQLLNAPGILLNSNYEPDLTVDQQRQIQEVIDKSGNSENKTGNSENKNGTQLDVSGGSANKTAGGPGLLIIALLIFGGLAASGKLKNVFKG